MQNLNPNRQPIVEQEEILYNEMKNISNSYLNAVSPEEKKKLQIKLDIATINWQEFRGKYLIILYAKKL